MKKIIPSLKEYSLITASTLMIVAGVYFFKFPNNFTFGGVTGLSVVLSDIFPFSPGTVNFAINMLLMILGFLFLGRKFGIKTVYSSALLSVGLSVMERIYPMEQPLTDEPMLELVFAIILPAFGSAILFNIGASSGGTDIIAAIVKKYSGADIGKALFLSDVLITLSSCFVFDIKTTLFSFLGLIAKSLVIDGVIENINLCKYFNVVCSNPAPICDFIIHKLNRSATVFEAQGAFSKEKKYVILSAMQRPQALLLRQYIKSVEPSAFLLISNTSEIIGKGFHAGD